MILRKVRYTYNAANCSYEPIKISLLALCLRSCLFIFCSVVVAIFMVRYYQNSFVSPREAILLEDNQRLKECYHAVQQKIESATNLLAIIQERDDALYRVLLGKNPLSDTQRNAGMGGVNKYAHLDKESLIAQTFSRADQLMGKLMIQKKSYDEILAHAHARSHKLKAMPTFPPLSKQHLKRVASGFGMRFDPIQKVRRMHEAIDFSAPMGTPIYAAADGCVKLVKNNDRGYGNYLLLDHGHGFQTRYAHMHTISVREQQRVKRGQQIGMVGSTGRSTAPHLHYEVYRNSIRVDPLQYLVWELTPSEYEAVLRQAKEDRQMLCY